MTNLTIEEKIGQLTQYNANLFIDSDLDITGPMAVPVFNQMADKVFDKEKVLQETIIVKVQKRSIKPDVVTITSTNSNKDFENCKSMRVPYDLVVSGEEQYVYLVTNKEEIAVLHKLQKWNKFISS